MIIQSKIYREFERECGKFLLKYKGNKITYPVNLKCLFYTKDKRKRDLSNLINAIQDVLVKYGIIEDDNHNIVKSLDGSRIIYRPDEKPQIIVEITKYEEK